MSNKILFIIFKSSVLRNNFEFILINAISSFRKVTSAKYLNSFKYYVAMAVLLA